MPSVENRVVRMEFDNATFQARVKQTLDSLTQLDKALKLEGAHKGLADVSAAANKVNLNPVQTAVQNVSSGFLAMSTIAITALSTITHAAITTGSSMIKSLSLDPILDGFREFELNVGSIQTILANTRADNTGLEQVNAALDKLNEFSDKTIFNFGEMTRNIGTFTAAGVDLDTSVQSIKGIANLAAISGSSSEQAASAMYQLSQAISTGTLRLIDWNSVVNAGLGGEVFQKALFETGKALGTINNVPINTTFEEWTSAGNSFRDSLQDGWLTAEVLTTTLQGFTGEMTEQQLLSIGYTKEQAAAILELGRTGVEAATKIRTFSQLLTTVRETIGSGWSQTFRTVIGDFNESSDLFTNINNVVSAFVNKQTEARNEILQSWKDMGGRTLLIEGLKDAFGALADIVKPIRDAFRDIFPPATAQSLFNVTKSFAEFANALRPSQTTIENIGRIFKGLFSVLDIGWEIVKQGVIFIKNLIVQITGLGSGRFLEFTADIADFFTTLRDGLDKGAAIKRFFDNLTEVLQGPIAFLKDLKDAITGLFDGFSSGAADAASAGVERFGGRMEQLTGAFDRLEGLGDRFRDVFERIMDVLDTIGEAIGNWFQELGQKLADAIGPGDFDAVLDALNVSLLGGITLLISKFLREGIGFDIGDGLFGNISQAFSELTGVLDAMQTNIKADAILKIAGAVGILTASVAVLALIDSDALTKALSAMAVGFTELMASFGVLSILSSGPRGAASFAIIAAGLVVMSTAILIMAGAVAVLAQLGWEQIAKGLSAIAAILAALVTTAIILSANVSSIFLASAGMIAMSVALIILAGAVAIFGTMEWDTLIRGFAAVAAGLLIIAGAMHLMPSPANMLAASAGLVLVGIALNAIAAAVKIFATMSWAELARGLAGAAGGLLAIAAAMHLMPNPLQMIASSVALILVGIALNAIALALKQFGGMSWSEIGRGLTALAGSLLILALATNAMTGALAGAAAIFIVSAALAVLANVLIKIAKVPFGDLIKAIGGIAIALAVFGLAAGLLSPVIPALLGLGVALLFIGGAFALFGVGALATAKAFEILAKAGPAAADAIVAAMQAIGRGIPALVAGFAQGIVDLIQVFADAAPVIAEALGVLLSHILDTLVEITPKLAELMFELIDVIIRVIEEKSPDIIQAGFDLLINFLQGISNNIEEIVNVVVDIITKFINALAERIQDIVDAGTNLLVKFLEGITTNLGKVTEAVGSIITTFITAVGDQAGNIVEAGTNAIIKFVEGLGQNANRIVTAGVDVVIKFLEGVEQNSIRLANAAFDIVITFLNELAAVIRSKSGELREAGKNIAFAVADGITFGFASKAKNIADSAVNGAKVAKDKVEDFLGIGSPSKEFIKIGAFMAEGMAIGLGDTSGVENSAESLGKTAVSSLSTIIKQISEEIGIIEDVAPTITPVLDVTQIRDQTSRLVDYISSVQPLNANSTFATAQSIAQSPSPQQNLLDAQEEQARGGLTFNQINNSPTQLSTGDIYRQTRNQITLAKEELGVP